ncbi:MAG: SseB family protein [Xanthomonadales bacterium]|nr:SseB family protein [Xanthomonadales bacterium]
MNAPDSFDELMEQSIQDFRKEPEFFRALLDATVYAHAPLNDVSERLRLVMFKSPDDGELVVPVFTDAAKAEFAARGNVRIVPLIGRTLFEITRGAILMLNPNDARCTLYPEEINELLASGTVAPVSKDQFVENGTRCYKLKKLPQPLTKALKKSLPEIRGIEIAYIAGLKWREPNLPDSVVIALGGHPESAEREARAVATALHRTIDALNQPVDLVHFDCNGAKPKWIRNLGLKPVYRRRPGPPMPISKFN